MKKPAYAAGVTAIYRKYIDLYYENQENFQVSKEDMNLLKSLYIRSEIGDGYYKRHNGREMITLNSPAYSGVDEKLMANLQQKYVEDDLCHEVTAKVCFKAGQASLLTLNKGGISVVCTGDIVQRALKQPLSVEKITDQVKKCGNSLIKITQVDVEMDDAIFMPVSFINELRRKAVEAFENEMICQNGFNYRNQRTAVPFLKNTLLLPEKLPLSQSACTDQSSALWKRLHIIVHTKEQLLAALKEKTGRIYLDYSLLTEDICRELRKHKKEQPHLPEFYLATPYIVRENNRHYLEKIKHEFADGLLFEGILIRNLESFYFIKKQDFPGKIILDANLYLWNHEAVSFWIGRAAEFYLPIEYNLHEWKELLQHCHQEEPEASVIVYGRLPMMITANCLNKTRRICDKKAQVVMLKDRYGKQFPVYTDCLSCYNIIYNSVPLSVHKLFEDYKWLKGNFRLDFTLEDAVETSQLIRYFGGLLGDYKAPFYKEYTTGHLKRGVE